MRRCAHGWADVGLGMVSSSRASSTDQDQSGHIGISGRAKTSRSRAFLRKFRGLVLGALTAKTHLDPCDEAPGLGSRIELDGWMMASNNDRVNRNTLKTNDL